jgi:hypothetical protein
VDRIGRRRRRIARPGGIGDFRETQLADVAGQGRLGDVEALRDEERAQALLALDPVGPDQGEQGGVALRFHGR